jgi:hypothetical protein
VAWNLKADPAVYLLKVTAMLKTSFALAALAVLAIAINTALDTPQDVRAAAQDQHSASTTLENAAGYIEARLAAQGYSVERRQYQHEGRQVRSLEVSLINVSRNKSPDRIFIIGAHYEPARGGGTAAVLELARMLKGMHLGLGTELKFVFFVNEEAPGFGDSKQGNFIAFVGAHEASEKVRKTLAAFRTASRFTVAGAASAPAYPAIMITDTAFLRYPYHHAAQHTDGKLDYQTTARAVEALAKVIEAIAGPVQM